MGHKEKPGGVESVGAKSLPKEEPGISDNDIT
jgi:hypothetical protein